MRTKRTSVELTCSHCGKTFRRRPSQIDRSKTLYCSRECFWAAPRLNSYDTRTCTQCGMPFITHGSNVRKGYGETCSRECADARRRDEERADRDSWQYTQWRKAVLERDSHTCQNCGATETKLHAHHVQSWADHPELRLDVGNGLTLCAACHRRNLHQLSRPTPA